METNEQRLLTDSIRDLEMNDFNNGIIQDNKLIFIVADKTYRVRMPIQSEQALVDNKKNMAQLEYLRQDGCITRKQLTQQLKNVGVFDVDKAEESREQLSKELKQMWFILATKSSDNKMSIEDCSTKIVKIQNELKNIAIDVATQLAPSLESRLEKFAIEYLTLLCTDVQVEGKWVRVWNTMEDFQKEDSSLTERASANVTWLMLNKRS
jgi:hypothetical protein